MSLFANFEMSKFVGYILCSIFQCSSLILLLMQYLPKDQPCRLYCVVQ